MQRTYAHRHTHHHKLQYNLNDTRNMYTYINFPWNFCVVVIAAVFFFSRFIIVAFDICSLHTVCITHWLLASRIFRFCCYFYSRLKLLKQRKWIDVWVQFCIFHWIMNNLHLYILQHLNYFILFIVLLWTYVCSLQ